MRFLLGLVLGVLIGAGGLAAADWLDDSNHRYQENKQQDRNWWQDEQENRLQDLEHQRAWGKPC